MTHLLQQIIFDLKFLLSRKRIMSSHVTKILLFFFTISFFVGEVYSENAEESFIAIAPDKELCLGSEGHFVPLPDMDSAEASFDYINLAIDVFFGSECKLNGLLIKGSITENTLPQLTLGLQLYEARRNHERSAGAPTLWLNSPGGLITEAMKIGDIIAEKEMNAMVLPFSQQCHSACVFIYAAAKTRTAFELGIHRPFAREITTKGLSYSQYLQKYDELTPIMKQYFAKYGVAPSLVDLMNVIPSDEIKILRGDEHNNYGLGRENIAAKEYDKAKTIELCGQEYYDMNLGFHALIKSCRERFDINVLDDKNSDCWDLAHLAYPNYSDEFDVCKEKRGKRALK